MRKNFNQQVVAGVAVLLVIGLTLAVALISALADNSQIGDIPSAALQPSSTPFLVVGNATPTPTSPLLQSQPQETATQTPFPASTSAVDCSYPTDWQPAIVGQADTIDSLAARFGTTAEILLTGNCLQDANLEVGQTIFVPPATETSNEETACGPPSDWVAYTVRAGENLFRVGLRYGKSVEEMLEANCLTSTNITSGQTLFVPPITPVAPTQTSLGDEPSVSPAGCPDPNVQITSPTDGETHSDIIFFFGTAQSNDFSFYKLEIRPLSDGNFITFDGAETAIEADFLGQVAAFAFPPGEYLIRLAVVDNNSEIVGECQINASLEGGPSN